MTDNGKSFEALLAEPAVAGPPVRLGIAGLGLAGALTTASAMRPAVPDLPIIVDPPWRAEGSIAHARGRSPLTPSNCRIRARRSERNRGISSR